MLHPGPVVDHLRHLEVDRNHDAGVHHRAYFPQPELPAADVVRLAAVNAVKHERVRDQGDVGSVQGPIKLSVNKKKGQSICWACIGRVLDDGLVNREG